MPTTIPLRAVKLYPDDGPANFCRALLQFYGALAFLLLALTLVEIQLGMHAGLSAWTAILKATGMDMFTSDFP